MADDQEQPRDRPGDGTDRPEGPDHTREFSPFADDGPEPPVSAAPRPAAPDGTAPLPRRPGAAAPDETATMPPAPDETAFLPPAADATARIPGPVDATAALPPADATAPLPRAGDETAPLAPAGGVWAGRAEVRPPDRTTVRGPAPAHWETLDEPVDGRRWYMPILVGILALVLLAALGVGVWLILDASDDDPAPVATPPAAPTATTPSAAPTSAPPTTEQPSPTQAEPQDVEVPALVGLSSDDAQQALEGVGLNYRLTYRRADAPEGTVVETDPPAGRSVPRDTQVTLVIATPLPTSAPPTSSAPASPPGTAPTG